jgi:hypothetical protein
MNYLIAGLLAFITIVLLYLGNRFLKDAKGIRKELSEGKTLIELDNMVKDTRDELMVNYDEVRAGLDKRLEKLEVLKKEADKTIKRLENLLDSERLKTLEERGILFAIEAGEKQGVEADRNTRIAKLLKSGASVEEVARITEASVREVELVRLLLKRKSEA